MVLFSSDFPHWHYDGVDALPIDHSSPLAKRILYDNPRETYPRLRLKEFSQ
jgi:predicted TIM-barrel fold metal-dependent hydrolase